MSEELKNTPGILETNGIKKGIAIIINPDGAGADIEHNGFSGNSEVITTMYLVIETLKQQAVQNSRIINPGSRPGPRRM